MSALGDSAITDPEIRDLGEKLILASRILENKGLLEYTGHMSARLPGNRGFLITPRMAPAIATIDSLIISNFEGKVIAGTAAPNSEWPLHACTYLARPDVGAVVHTHSFMSRVFSVSPRRLVPLMGPALHAFSQDGVPVYDGAGLVTKFEQGQAVATTLDKESAVLLRGHGSVVIGRHIQQLTYNTIILENMAQVLQSVLAHGEPTYFNDEECVEWAASVPVAAVHERAWEYYVWRLQTGS